MCIANHWTLLKPIIAYVLIGQLEREKKFSRSASRMQTPAGFFQWFLAKSMVIFKIMCCCMLRINKFGANWGQGETKRRYVNQIFTKRNVKFYKLLSLTQGLRELMIFHHFTFQWPVLLHNLNWTVFATTCVAFLTRKKNIFMIARPFSWPWIYWLSKQCSHYSRRPSGNMFCSGARFNCWSYHPRKLAQYLLTHPRRKRGRRGVQQRRSLQWCKQEKKFRITLVP